MFLTLTQLQYGEATLLQSVVDNTGGRLHVAVRGLHYQVGYRNVGSKSGIYLRPTAGNRPREISVPSGLYNFEQLARVVMEEIPGLTLKITKATGMIKLSIPDSAGIIKLSNDLCRLLGIEEKVWLEGEYIGDTPASFSLHKWLFIYLDQLSTASNLVDGAPSSLLAIVLAAAGGVVDINPACPMYKKLEAGHIDQLNLRVLNETGALVQNRDKPITAVLEIVHRDNA